MRTSLIISTYNRAHKLKQCLQYLPLKDIKDENVEVLIADNASSDNTHEVIRRFKEDTGFPLSVSIEERKGSAYNRNAALSASHGDFIIFIDDDCYLERNYFKIFRGCRIKYPWDYFGGGILLYDKTDSYYGCTSARKPIILKPHSFIPTGLIQGSNMGITRKVFETIGYFDVDLGAGTAFRFDDIDYIARASIAGFVGYHIPELIIYHHHDRKPGTKDLDAVIKGNDYGRGSYYMKLLVLGNYKFLTFWKKGWQKNFFSSIRIYELKGFFGYLLHLIRKCNKPKVKIDSYNLE